MLLIGLVDINIKLVCENTLTICSSIQNTKGMIVLILYMKLCTKNIKGMCVHHIIVL